MIPIEAIKFVEASYFSVVQTGNSMDGEGPFVCYSSLPCRYIIEGPEVPATSHSCHSCLQEVCHPTCKCSYSSKPGRTNHAQCCFKSVFHLFFRVTVTVTGTKVACLFVVRRLW